MILENALKAFILGMLVLLLSCSQHQEEGKAYDQTMSNAESNADTSYANNGISSSAAIENNKDTIRKFIRTADLKFKAKDVLLTTYQIEDITSRYGGFVTYTNLTSHMDYHTVTKVSADSSLESTYYTVVNSMSLRVPNIKLDSTLKAIGKLVDYMDYRVIRADDIGLSILSNKLAQRRLEKHEKRLTDAIDKKGKKLWETTDAEENLYSKEEQADNAYISNLSMMDQVQFSTVSLNIYQKQGVKQVLVANEKNISSYEPPFTIKLMESLYTGWVILEAFILFVTRLWGILLFVILAVFIYRKFSSKLFKRKQV